MEAPTDVPAGLSATTTAFDGNYDVALYHCPSRYPGQGIIDHCWDGLVAAFGGTSSQTAADALG
ncbi:MAG: hypothetical protein ACRDY2_03035 [Acidimicrobiales bacterium]